MPASLFLKQNYLKATEGIYAILFLVCNSNYSKVLVVTISENNKIYPITLCFQFFPHCAMTKEKQR